ncbi:hypothetical protein ACFSWE_05725 [Leucobacter albus]|uniref:Glycoside hydrolase family 5 C-terminal domain-containing protein n=1 Tax=Leucobacter albus TaxID=272210 RepID=A0ABW3TJE2_9MICO
MKPITYATAALAAVALALGGTPAGAAEPATSAGDTRFGIPSGLQGPITPAGKWLVDGTGRVAQFHGFNLMHRLAPYTPAPFSAADASWLADQGFNSMRLGVMYEAVEPELDRYDDDYIAEMVDTNRMLAQHGFVNTIDFHNDVFAQQFNGDGFPEWAVPSDPTMEASWERVAATQEFQDADDKYSWQAQYNPLERHAWDRFWTNAELPNGVGLQDQFVAAWKHVAEAFAADQEGLLGYSPLNEPLNGNCVQPVCDHIPEQRIPFYEKWLDAVRDVDQDRIAYVASDLWFAGTQGQDANENVARLLGALDDPALAIERHNYAFGEQQLEQYINDDRLATKHQTPFVVNEFFAGFGPASKAAIDVDMANARSQSWMMWSYYAESEICCSGSGFLLDQTAAASDANAKPDVADALITPYTQAVAGIPGDYAYDRAARTLEFEYSTAAAGKARSSERTVVFVPKRVYDTGYTVAATGATVVSDPTSPWLVLENTPGAETVAVTVSPATDSTVLLPSEYCAAQSCAVDGPGDTKTPPAPGDGETGPEPGNRAAENGPLALSGMTANTVAIVSATLLLAVAGAALAGYRRSARVRRLQ